jgi:hypothetical protein
VKSVGSSDSQMRQWSLTCSGGISQRRGRASSSSWRGGARHAGQGGYAAIDEFGSHGGGTGLEDDMEKLGNRVPWFELFIGKI